MPANSSKVISLDKSPVDLALLYTKITGEQLTRVAENEWAGKCILPGHDDHEASCHYNQVKGVAHCKVCASGYGAVELVRQHFGMETRNEAIKWLTDNKLLQSRNPASDWELVDVTYDYTDEEGELLLQIGRWHQPKHFSQRVPDGKGKWVYKVSSDVRRVPYQLPALIRAVSRGETIYVVEGEKDALNLGSLGFTTTTNAQGAKWKWPIEWSAFFEGAELVVVIADNDKAGREGAHQRAGVIARSAKRVVVLEAMPGVGLKGDVSDWLLLMGSTYEAMEEIVEKNGVLVQAYVPAYPPEAVESLVHDLSDIGNGRWFASCVGKDYRYILDVGHWLGFTGDVWEDSANMISVSHDAADLMKSAFEDYSGPLHDDFETHVGKSRDGGRLGRMLEQAQGKLSVRSTAFDAHSTLFNCSNGTLDLVTGDLLPHSRDHFLTLMTPVAYDAKAECPNFRTWLMDACNQSQPLFDYMQQVMGSCLEGKVGLRRFFFIFGPKGTGKSTFIRTLEALLGPYQCSTDFKSLTETKFGSDGNGPTPALARLKGRRMVTASESRDSDRLDVARIKQLIGGDSITARHLNSHMQEFRFEATLILSGNEMPRIVGDESIWSKFKPVPFIHAIEGEDPNFEERVLHPELPGILRFALEGLLRLRAQDYRIDDPKEVVDARLMEMDMQDPFSEWFLECVERGSDKAPCDVIYQNYVEWCEKNKAYVHKRQKLTRWMGEKHQIVVQQANVNKFYLGIRPRHREQRSNGGSGF